MNSEKFTQKSLEALSAAHEFALKYKHTNIKNEHLILALISQMNGLIPKLLEKMGKNTSTLIDKVEKNLNLLPSVNTLNPSNISMNRNLNARLNEAEKIAEKMKDSYISVEHLFISLLENKILREEEIKK
jgi:ATP-dependent Clp protease ATP-binding subunit ClpB